TYLFAPAEASRDGVTLAIQPVAVVQALEAEIPVVVTLTRQVSTDEDAAILRGAVALEVIDTWRVVGEAPQDFELPPGGTAELSFTCVAGAGSYAAHYPIHARATVATASGELSLHAVLVVEVAREAVGRAVPTDASLRVRTLGAPGRLSLLSLADARTSFRVGDSGEPTPQPVGWAGTDATTGATLTHATVSRGDRRMALSVHPPWKTGWGSMSSEWIVSLPEAEPILLDFATAIRDHNPETEPPSDGVQFEVWTATEPDGEAKRVWSRFSDAKRWEPARVSLTGLGGMRVRLILVTDPGPHHNTTCDAAYWADPVLIAGVEPAQETPPHARQAQEAEAMAQRALRGDVMEHALRLSDVAAAAILPGAHGIADGLLSLAMGAETLTYRGFRVEVDGRRIGDWRSGFTYGPPQVDGDVWTLPVRDGDREFVLRTRVWTEAGGLRLRFSLTGAERDAAGHPRVTHLSLGPVDRKVRRLYAGHGNVLEEPGRLRLGYNGFNLSTSFVGFDFENGLSLVQATDIPPDALTHDPDADLATLEAHHDVTWTLVPSTSGAFDAARQYRSIAAPAAPESLPKIAGRMCLDRWSGDYARAAADIDRAAVYGLTHAVFVKHVWQRWGYDYRLPDIYPPAGNADDFQAMADACERAGVLFAPHDNYIDFYPDAPGFSYRHVIFNDDGTPQRAWYNRGREAQSYRWLSHAFGPWMDENLASIQDGIAPTSYFIDVFSAITPRDYRDEAGRFYPSAESVKRWAEAFDMARERFDGAPMISEAGHDALIGHLDAAQADHMAWTPADSSVSGSWAWKLPAGDGERIPWHDMVTHGAFTLFAGGLGNRYQGDASRELHGYGSDDYLAMTVLGGRSPMCDGPFNRSAVMTYWLLHDLSAELESREMTQHRFADDNIHRQVVRFGQQSEVAVNRGEADWEVDGHRLPSYGFYAEAGEQRAAIERIDGTIAAWAEGPDALFFDARPPEHFGGVPIRAEVVGAEMVEGRRFRLRMRWKVDSPVQERGNAFLHFTNADVAPDGEQIVFQGHVPLSPERWSQAGESEVDVEAALPDDAPAGTYGVRFGIYQPERGGRRLRLQGRRDGTGRRDGGELTFEASGENPIAVTHTPPPPDSTSERLNMRRAIVDFGPAATNGAFRFLKRERTIIPLPGGAVSTVVLRPEALGIGPTVSRIEALSEDGTSEENVPFTLGDGRLTFATTPDTFAYRLWE
ncbi:hypothetical protein HOK31_29550, partial [Candidatus Poribacteria bacterium]|nr:hypothetical protein [Candidatus Poribacteria bacterium]